jgi:hypothetical protein
MHECVRVANFEETKKENVDERRGWKRKEGKENR